MKFFMLLILTAMAAPTFAKDGTCELGPKAQSKFIGVDEATRRSSALQEQREEYTTVPFIQYFAGGQIETGVIRCPDVCGWHLEEIYQVKGNSDCSIKYVDVGFGFEHVFCPKDANESGEKRLCRVRRGDEVSMEMMTQALESYTETVQSVCDKLNQTAKGESKIEVLNKSIVNKSRFFNTVKSVTVNFAGRCIIAD